MARKRMIDPSIWDSEKFANLSMTARVLYIGMISLADDYGRGRANVKFLKSRIFGYDDDIPSSVIEKALNQISARMAVKLYESDGFRYYWFRNWGKWQTICHPTDSKLPDPEKCTDYEPEEEVQENSREFLESFENSSAQYNLKEKNIKENNIREDIYPPSEPSDTSSGAVGDAELESSPIPSEEPIKEKKRKPRSKQKEEPYRFEEFWSVYPRKDSKEDARRAWIKLAPDDPLIETILADVRARRGSKDWLKDNGEFIPYPATYLNKKRWNDKGVDPLSGAKGYEEHDFDCHELDKMFINLDG